MYDFAALAAAGLGVGVVVGLTGVGAGAVMTPLLIAGFGVPVPVAVGTDLACAAISKTAGTLAHRAAHNVVTRVVVLLAFGSVPAAVATLVFIAVAEPSTATLAHVMRSGIAILLIASIAMLLLRTRAVRSRRASTATWRWRAGATIGVGAVMGCAVALTSLGAGAIGAACIAFLHPELDARQIAGSDIAHAVPLTLVAAAGHAWLGTIDWSLLLALAMGAVPGIVVGSLLTRAVPADALRYLLIATLAFAAFKLLA